MTAGQAACEAFDALVLTPGPGGTRRSRWERLDDDYRAAWEAAAQAAIDHERLYHGGAS